MKYPASAAACILLCTMATASLASDHDEGDTGGGFSSLFSTGTKTKVTAGQNAPDINQVQAEAYNGPKARIAIARFTDKTGSGWYNGRIGRGMADQLATALFSSQRFILLERRILQDVLKEQNLGASGRVRRDTAAPIGQIEGAELLVTGAVTEFQRAASGGGGRVSGGLFGSLLGAVSGAFRKAHMAIDMRIIDTRTSRIVAATSVEGESTDVNLGGALTGYFGGGALGASLSGWKNTPIEKALRATINEAVKFIVSKTPPVYYRHGAQTVSKPATASPQRTAAPSPRPAAKPVIATQSYASGSVVRVKSQTLNVRGGPGSRHAVQFVAARNDPLLVMKQSGTWLQVQDQNGKTGWVASWLTYPDAAAAARAPSKITPAPAPAQTRKAAAQPAPAPTPAGDPVARLKRLKKLYDAELISEEEYRAKRQKILDTL